MSEELKKSKEHNIEGPYNRFLYGLHASESKRQYPKRLAVFLCFVARFPFSNTNRSHLLPTNRMK